MGRQFSSTNLSQRIITHLTIQAPFIEDIGLFHGKMGIALSLYCYSKYTNCVFYQNFADDLMEQICDSADKNNFINIERGFSGIAWGICYLIENHFISGDLYEILKEIDEKIMEYSPIRSKDLSVRTGIAGIWMYVQKRLEISKREKSAIPFDSIYLAEIQKVIVPSIKPNNMNTPLDYIVFPNHEKSISFLELPLGLNNGCAGIILKESMT